MTASLSYLITVDFIIKIPTREEEKKKLTSQRRLPLHFVFSLYFLHSLAADWKVTNIECVLERLLETCPNLEAISVSGWKEFTGDHLAFLVQKFKSLQRIDLSSVNVSLYTPIKY